MGVIAVVLDAANIACKNRRNGEPPQWQFSRVERVRAACLTTWPGAHVRAVIDASAEHRLTDRHRSEAAHAEGWLYTASGDADDRVLEMAAKLGAPVVSKDNFYDARRNYPWLEDEERVWTFGIQKDRSVVLRPRRLLPVSDEQVAEARRKKARKAGVVSVGVDEVWLCAAPSEQECKYAGQPVQVTEARGRRVCRLAATRLRSRSIPRPRFPCWSCTWTARNTAGSPCRRRDWCWAGAVRPGPRSPTSPRGWTRAPPAG